VTAAGRPAATDRSDTADTGDTGDTASQAEAATDGPVRFDKQSASDAAPDATAVSPESSTRSGATATAGGAATGDTAERASDDALDGPVGDRGTRERAGSSPWVWAPAAVLGLAAVVLGVLCIVFAARGSSSSTSAAGTLTAADSALRQKVLAAAKGCVVRVNSYDYRTFAADEKQALQCTTGQYSKDFKKTFEGVIMKYGPKLHATQTAQIDTAGIEQVSSDGKQWTLLLFGQLTATNNTSATSGRVDPLAIKVTVQKVGSQWLIAKLGGPGD
jgi:hypothetical protein